MKQITFLVFIVLFSVYVRAQASTSINNIDDEIMVITCNGSFLLINITCQSENNSNCSDAKMDQGNCTICQGNITIFDKNCISENISNCVDQNINGNEINCTQCQNGSILMENRCFEQTVPNCEIHQLNNNLLQCLGCKDNFNLSNSQCLSQIIPNCADYTTEEGKPSVCADCQVNFVLQKSQCLSQIIPNCANYTTEEGKPSVCTDCQVNYTLVDQKCISQQIPHCVALHFIDGTLICTNCQDNYTVVNQINCVFSYFQNCKESQPKDDNSSVICAACQDQYILVNDTQCILKNIPYCIEYKLSQNNESVLCKACKQNYIIVNDTECFTIKNCIKYNLINQNSSLTCVECSQAFMNAQDNCTGNPNFCQQFDQKLGKCISCSNDTFINSDGSMCNQNISRCEIYSSGLCVSCQQGFILNNDSCTYLPAVKKQILIYDRESKTFYQVNICFDKQASDDGNGNCNVYYNSNIPHCATNSQSSCTKCLPGYYLSATDNSCIQCGIVITNCLLCSSSSFCLACDSGYYVSTKGTEAKCLSCSIYGCLECSSNLTASGNVTCLSCPINSTLYFGSCIRCMTPNFAFSVSHAQCRNCSQSSHCRFCMFTLNHDQIMCLQCQQNYFLNSNNLCQRISISQPLGITDNNVDEILKKLAPGIEVRYYNNPIGLMGVCNSTNGFVCNCNSAYKTSICTDIANNEQIMVSNGDLGSISQAGQHSDALRMAAEFKNFKSEYLYNIFEPYIQRRLLAPSSNDVLTQYQFWNLLSACAYVMSRDYNSIQKLGDYIGNFVNINGNKMFSEQRVTILQGNGFYFKYIPAHLKNKTGDDSYIFTNISNEKYTTIFVFFHKLHDPIVMTGVTFVRTDINDKTITLIVRKSWNLFNTSSYFLKNYGLSKGNNAVTLNQGYYTIVGVPPSGGVQVLASQFSDSVQSLYYDQRIENIFYSESWLYILFFIALYLLFIPLCAIVDCCEQGAHLRKKIGSEDSGSERQSEDTTIVKVNYREFFPIYNVGNTARPHRLRKLCLFIVNMQHIITFLTLIYFKFEGGQPVGAIALVIPAYLCTIAMGYICGAIFRSLPSNTKYLINLFSIGYWILWVFVMRVMSSLPSSEYRLFILVFSIMSFALDLVIDALETLLVYFAIRQGENQVSLFNFLAKWLSRRGFYEFDQLAKEIGEEA